MMDGPSCGSVMLAITLIGFAIWLQRNEDQTRSSQGKNLSDNQVDRHYLNARLKSRRRTNRLIGISGTLILTTAFINHPVAWMLIWLLVMLCLLIVIGLAGKDAIRTYRYHQAKLSEVRRPA